jgi:hypothetical protein
MLLKSYTPVRVRMPKSKNEVIMPERETGHDDPYLETLAKEKKLQAKMTVIETKLKFEMEQNPPLDTSSSEERVDYWERGMQASLQAIKDGISYQEDLILQIETAAAQKVATIKSRIAQSREKLAKKETFWSLRISSAQADYEHTKHKLDPKQRKLQLEKEAIQKELDALQSYKKYLVAADDAKELRKEKKAVVLDYDSDDSYDEDKHGDMEYDGKFGFKAWSSWRLAKGKEPY